MSRNRYAETNSDMDFGVTSREGCVSRNLQAKLYFDIAMSHIPRGMCE